MITNRYKLGGIITARSAASGPCQTITYDAVANEDGYAVRVTASTPRRWYPAGVVVFAAPVGDDCFIYIQPGAAPVLEVNEQFDPAFCGVIPS